MLKLVRFLLLGVLIAVSGNSTAQSHADTAHKSVDLNEFVVRKSGMMKPRKRRLIRTALLMRPEAPGRYNAWDSLLLLTRFPAPSARPMVLHSVSSQLAALDTSKLDLYLVVIQLCDADTLQHRIRITPDMLDAETQRLDIDLRDSVITLQPSPFYLGFAFHVKPLSEQYIFPFYYTKGGDGAVLSFPNGRWVFISHPHSIYIFPFQLEYVESGA